MSQATVRHYELAHPHQRRIPACARRFDTAAANLVAFESYAAQARFGNFSAIEDLGEGVEERQHAAQNALVADITAHDDGSSGNLRHN